VRARPVLRGSGVVHAHGDLRRQHLLFHLQVGQAGDAHQPRAQGLGLATQGVQVVTKELDGDLRAHAREHVVDAVRDGLADGNGGGQVRQAAADVGLHLGHAALELGCRQQAHVQLTHVHAFGVFVQLGAAAAPAHMRDLGHLAHQHLGLARQRARLGQRDAGVQPHADEQRAFVERRQKGGGKSGTATPTAHRHHAHRHSGRFRVRAARPARPCGSAP
jgi:hypothetical protein